MADSVTRKAWKDTELKGFKKIFGSLGVGGLTLLLNYETGLRPLGLTMAFLGCSLAAYVIMTALEFAGRYTFLLISSAWETFTNNLRAQIIAAVREDAPQSTKGPPRIRLENEFLPDMFDRVREFLKEKPAGTVRIVGEEGDPQAYLLMQRLADAFEQAKWKVTRGRCRIRVYSEKSICDRKSIESFERLDLDSRSIGRLRHFVPKIRDSRSTICDMYNLFFSAFRLVWFRPTGRRFLLLKGLLNCFFPVALLRMAQDDRSDTPRGQFRNDTDFGMTPSS